MSDTDLSVPTSRICARSIRSIRQSEKPPGTLGAYRKGFAIHEALGTRDPAITAWQRDLILSL